jgi:hypothetical protein
VGEQAGVFVQNGLHWAKKKVRREFAVESLGQSGMERLQGE